MRSVVVLAAFAAVGCASISDGTDQTIIVTVKPKEARCSVVRSDTELGQVSGTSPTITVSKGARDILIHCNAPGYTQKSQRLVSSTQTSGIVGGFFLDLGITDMITGAMWKYPGSVTIELDRELAGAPPVAPSTPIAVTPVATPVASPVATTPAAGPAIPFNKQMIPGGQDSPMVERMARDAGCDPNSRAALTAKGPGFELYTLQCTAQDTWSVRCEFGQCRVLR